MIKHVCDRCWTEMPDDATERQRFVRVTFEGYLMPPPSPGTWELCPNCCEDLTRFLAGSALSTGKVREFQVAVYDDRGNRIAVQSVTIV